MYSLDSLSFAYPRLDGSKGAAILREISLQIEATERLAIWGASGSGKSTLLHLLLGLQSPDRGSLQFQGRELDSGNLQKLRQLCGLVMQFPEKQLFAATVAEDIAFAPLNQGLAGATLQQRIDESLLAVGLPPGQFRQRGIDALSAGEKRRVAIAGVLAMQPQMLMLDEPTAGLDGAGRQELGEILQKHRAGGGGFVVASHDLAFVAQHCTRLLWLSDGQIALDIQMTDLQLLAEAQSDPAILPRAMRLAAKLRAMGIAVPPEVHTRSGLSNFLSEMPV